MSERIARPFTREEMAAMRRAMRDEETVAKGFWAALWRVAGKVPFAEDLLAAYYCAMDPKTPRRVRLILIGALAYFILPTDAISDFLPLIGFTDDMAVLAAAIAAVSTSITDAHRDKARRTLAGGLREAADG
jgi:uncharacterized membrane protein YkvA (DUF1232 family)